MLEVSFETRDEGYRWMGDGEDLLLNGKLLPSATATRSEFGNISVEVSDADDSSLLTCHTIDDLSHQGLWLLTVALDSPVPDLSLKATLFFNNEAPPVAALQITWRLSVRDWAGPWSLAEYGRAIGDALATREGNELVLDASIDTEDGEWSFNCFLPDPNATVRTVLDHWIPVTHQIIQKAEAALAAQLQRDTLVTFFDFPRHVSTACEQYLLYFVQFLRDLGIEADANIKHEAHQVLFSVTPQEGAEALDRIREALDVYLRLPESPEFATQAPAYGDIAVQQLQANIYHLKSQMMVASAVLHARNAQIEALQLSNFTYQQLLATQQQAATLPLLPPGKPNADAEPLVPGVIDVTKYEGKGFTVNFAEILRRLKRRFDQE